MAQGLLNHPKPWCRTTIITMHQTAHNNEEEYCSYHTHARRRLGGKIKDQTHPFEAQDSRELQRIIDEHLEICEVDAILMIWDYDCVASPEWAIEIYLTLQFWRSERFFGRDGRSKRKRRRSDSESLMPVPFPTGSPDPTCNIGK